MKHRSSTNNSDTQQTRKGFNFPISSAIDGDLRWSATGSSLRRCMLSAFAPAAPKASDSGSPESQCSSCSPKRKHTADQSNLTRMPSLMRAAIEVFEIALFRCWSGNTSGRCVIAERCSSLVEGFNGASRKPFLPPAKVRYTDYHVFGRSQSAAEGSTVRSVGNGRYDGVSELFGTNSPKAGYPALAARKVRRNALRFAVLVAA